LITTTTGCSNRQSSINRTPQTGASTAVTAAGVQVITLTTGDDYRFTPDTITVHPGSIKVILINKGTGAPHNFSVTGLPGDFVPLANAGKTTAATFTAPAPGRYEFVCTIHVAQGQTGILIVLPD
jgi:plastocyanin